MLGKTVARLNDELGANEFVYWQAYYLDEPFGPLGDDMRAGVIASILVNQNREKGADAIKPLDVFAHRKRPETPEELKARIKRDLMGIPNG